MQRIVRVPGIKGGSSYDIWDEAKRNRTVNFVATDYRSREFPVFSHYFCDETIRGDYWFKHVDYSYMAIELNLAGGVINYQSGGNLYVTRPGMIFIIPQGSTVHISSTDPSIRKMWVLVSGTCYDSVISSIGLNFSQLITLADPQRTANAMREIGDAIQEKRPSEYISQLTYALLLELAAEARRSPKDIKAALDQIALNPGAPLSIPKLVKLCGVSNSTFHRHFLDYTGFTPMQYIIRQRLAMGTELLKNSDAPIGEVAQKCGFNNHINFTVAFKNLYTLTPSQYRAKFRKDK